MKVQLTDIVQFKREVEIPDECPHCHALLLQVGLKAWEYQDQFRSVNVVPAEDTGDLIVDWGDHVPVPGDENDIALAWRCGNCNATLAESEESVVNGEEFVQGTLRKTVKQRLGWCEPGELHPKTPTQ